MRVSPMLPIAALVLTCSAVAQTPVASDASPRRDYHFEVASIRPGPPDGSGRPGPSYTPGRFRQEVTSIDRLAYTAFGKKQGFEIDCPPWMWRTYFTVDAKLPEGATQDDLPIMVRHLLEDRFGLKYHHVTRQMAGYQLVLAKSGAKMEKQDGPTSDSLGSGFDVKDGIPQFAKDSPSSIGCTGLVCWFHGRNRTIQTLAEDLSRQLRAPVSDATGLEGGYDYTAMYTPDALGPEVDADERAEPMKAPILTDAVREQLGLELKPVKNVSVDVVVLDSANKEPTEN